MTPFDLACLAALAAITITQFVLVALFGRLCAGSRARPPSAPSADGLAPARIVLCLRGSDPFLAATLRAAIDQDHPDYELRIIVDSRADPAWAEVHEAIAAAGLAASAAGGLPVPPTSGLPVLPSSGLPVLPSSGLPVLPSSGLRGIIVEPLESRPAASSLKCASVLQGLRGLDDSIGMVALLDADVVPPRHWLGTLAKTLADDRCGVATGNRWYQPPDAGLGTWTRAAWNGGALVQMVCFGIPWGGTLAIRRDVLDAAELPRKWAEAFCEDTLLPAAIRGLGKQVRFVPELIAINRESVTMASLLPWISRQLLTARLYHPAWMPVAGFGLSVPVVLAATAFAVGLAVARGDGTTAARLLAGAGLFVASLPVLLAWIEQIVRRSVAGIITAGEPSLSSRLPLMLAGVVVAQCVYVAALVRASLMRSSQWRGATYAIDGPWQIRLVSDSWHADGERAACQPSPRALQSL